MIDKNMPKRNQSKNSFSGHIPVK